MEKKTTSVAGQVIGLIVYLVGVWLVMVGLFKLIDLYADRVCEGITALKTHITTKKGHNIQNEQLATATFPIGFRA